MSRILVALLALALALPVAAQAPAKRPEEPRDLAAAYLSKRGADGRFDRSMAAYRTTAVRMLVDMGAPEPLAGEIWDAEVTPGYEAKRLDMVARDQDVVLRHLTGAEMQAVLAGGASEASRSAARIPWVPCPTTTRYS